MNSRRSGPSALGFKSTPFLPSQMPAKRRSGPRLARVSSATSSGSVKMSSGISLMVQHRQNTGIVNNRHGFKHEKARKGQVQALRQRLPGMAERRKLA